MIELKNVSKVYKQGASAVKVLENLSFCLEEKGIIGITGKSGSGKSTLLSGYLLYWGYIYCYPFTKM